MTTFTLNKDLKFQRHHHGQGAWLLAFWLLIIAILIVPIFLFLLMAFSPALLSQGTEWFTLSSFQQVFTSQQLQAFINSLFIGIVTAVLAAGIAFWLAWISQRTDLLFGRILTGVIFGLLLIPSYLIAFGWERLLEPNGVLMVLGYNAIWLRSVVYGPVGIVIVLTMKGVPFAYLAIGNALRGLGREFEDAVRVHGGGRFAAIKMAATLLAPGIWAALAIVFAESISDYGVASTLANDSHFLVATYALYTSVDAFPVQFPVAAAISWVLLILIILALFVQNRALQGRSYRVLGARSRPAGKDHLRPLAALINGLFAVSFVVLSLGIPTFGAVAASLIDGLGSLAGSHQVDLSNYQRVLTSPALGGPLVFSAWMAMLTAIIATFLAAICARMMTSNKDSLAGKLLDFVLLAAVALPGIVFAAGYIFAYNLPLWKVVHIQLYGTTTLLLFAYLATALPSTTRVLFGTMNQVQNSLFEAARVHGYGKIKAWFTIVFPVIARPMLSAWLLTFAGTLLELPVSQLLSPAGQPPLSIGIETALSKYDLGGGTAMEVLAILFALVVIIIVNVLFRFLAPKGWHQIGKANS